MQEEKHITQRLGEANEKYGLAQQVLRDLGELDCGGQAEFLRAVGLLMECLQVTILLITVLVTTRGLSQTAEKFEHSRCAVATRSKQAKLSKHVESRQKEVDNREKLTSLTMYPVGRKL